MRLRRLSSSGVRVERRLVFAESREDSGRRSKCWGWEGQYVDGD